MALPEGLAATKVIAVHLNYRSRAEQRGRTPAVPSYFLKPPSSLAGDGDQLVRPRGAELMTFEGEIALVIGRRARNVAPAEAVAHIGWYAPANDVGVADLRWADRGSNLLSKGQDGFTPLGPCAPADAVDPTKLVLETRVNGELRQRADVGELLFSFGELIADLSRFITLERGDVILTGTPAGGGVVVPGDVVEVALSGVGTVRNEVVADARELPPYGAQPRADAAARAYATGANSPRPAVLSEAAKGKLRAVSTATLTAQLAQRGLRSTFLAGLRPTRPGERMVGYARTLRYVALREDVRETLRGREDAQKRAVETASPEEVVVMEARGLESCGTIGDILAARLVARGAAGVVTDGGLRDSPAAADVPLPIYYRAANATSLWHAHIPLELDVPVTCAGVLVMPGDVVVGDAEGVVIVPAALAEEVAHDAYEQELREAWALERVQAGESIRGIYPLSDARREEYAAWRQRHDQEPSR